MRRHIRSEGQVGDGTSREGMIEFVCFGETSSQIHVLRLRECNVVDAVGSGMEVEEVDVVATSFGRLDDQCVLRFSAHCWWRHERDGDPTVGKRVGHEADARDQLRSEDEAEGVRYLNNEIARRWSVLQMPINRHMGEPPR